MNGLREPALRTGPPAGYGFLFAIGLLALLVGLFVTALPGLPVHPRWLVVSAILPLVLSGLLVASQYLDRALLILLALSVSAEIDIHPQFQPGHVGSPPGLPLTLTGFTAILLWITYGLRRERRPFPIYQALFPFVVVASLFIIGLASATFAPQPQFSFYALFGFLLQMLMFFYLIAGLEDIAHLKFLLRALMVWMLIMSTFGILQFFVPRLLLIPQLGGVPPWLLSPLPTDPRIARVVGLLGSPNNYSWYLVTFMPLVLAWPYREKRWERPVQYLTLALATGALIATFSRGAWFALLVGLVAFLFLLGLRGLAQPRYPVNLLRRFVPLLIASLILVVPAWNYIYSRITGDDQGAAQTRIPLIQISQNIIRNHPWLGIGLGNYIYVMDNYDDTSERVTRRFRYPVHNVYLHLASEIGLPGLFLWLSLVFYAMLIGLQVALEPEPRFAALALGLLSGVVANLIVGLKEPGTLGVPYMVYLWFALGVLLALRRLKLQAP
jgi:putative inorganic carbon (HCO3(-)) transporter